LNTRHLRPEQLVGRRWRGLVRESTEAQADKWSPERQRSDLRRAADELGLVPAEPLFYERVGSGEAEGASELVQALADAGQYDVLVVLATSRFARNRAEAVRMKARFAKAGIVIYFVAQRIVSGAYASGLTEGIHEVIDEQENETRRFWIAGGQRQRQMSGRWVGAVPYGLRKALIERRDGSRGWDGDLELDPVTAPVVRSIFVAAAAGQGSSAIAADLNARGERTAQDKPWSRGAVDTLLANPVYAGRLIRYRARLSRHYYDHDAQDGHVDLGERLPALIDPALFDQVRTQRKHTPTPGSYPLSGVLRCKCGHRMTGARGGAGRRYYRCSNRVTSGACDAPGIRADTAEDAFTAWFGSIRLPQDWRAAVARSAVVRSDEKARSALTERLERLRDLYAWGDLTDEAYRAQASEVRSQIGVMATPDMVGIEAVADALTTRGPAWRAAPLVLKAVEADHGRLTWVVHAKLRPLLELCAPTYAVRFA
jgi:DNA invertase Pin-like site-specific DNA recombinase